MNSNPTNIFIRRATTHDAPAICHIYNHYILHTIITFEEQPISPDEMEKRIRTVSAQFPWLVAESNQQIIGYAYAGEWAERSAYRYSVESSIYLHHESGGKGVGRMLYQELITLLKQQRIHAMIGGIALPNEASVAFHSKLGFQPVAHFKEVGFKQNRWIDVGYWQLVL